MGRKCEKCGADLQENARFCPKCGAPVTVTNSTSSVYREGDGRKKKIPYAIIIIIGILVVAIGIFIVTRPKTIVLNDYLEFSVEGYDGYGTAYATLNEDKFARDIYTIAQKKKKSGYLDEERMFSGVKLDVNVTPNENLANGDKIKIEFEYDKDDFKEYGIKLNAKNITKKVNGLKAIKEVDIFKDLNLEFYGTAPMASTDSYVYLTVDGVVFDCIVTPNVGLGIGDEITVECIYPEPYNGLKPKKTKTTVKVPENIEHFVLEPSELTEDDKEQMKDVVNKIVTCQSPYRDELAYAYIYLAPESSRSSIALEDCVISNISIANDMDYYISKDDVGSYGCNGAIIRYEFDATVDDEYYEENGNTYHCYGYCIFTTLIKKEDGTLELDDMVYIRSSELYELETEREEEITYECDDMWGERTEYKVAF